MTVLHLGITGAAGMLGWHLRCAALGLENVKVSTADRATFSDQQALCDFTRGLDVLIHFAGQNRGEAQEVYDTNIALANQLLSACEASGARPHLMFSNSTHCDRDTLYGASKRAVAAQFYAWAESHKVGFHDLVLPHVFGESGRPFYNSVVHTFCHQLATGEDPQVEQDGQLELIHAGRAADLFLERVQKNIEHRETVRIHGRMMKVSELLQLLHDFHLHYHQHQIFPDLRDSLHLDLFNVLRSAMYPQEFPVSLIQHQDQRGSLFEAVKGHQGGQSFVSTTHPGITRGHHFHRHKVERFLVVQGEARVCIRRMFDRKVQKFQVRGAAPAYVDIPTLHAHSITNTGSKDLLTLFWAHEIFDPSHPDTFAEEV